ncbi:hypothetical protein AVDCRST_MAG94-5040, partial [uncultured Leptolyngbya sp.]
MQLCLLNPNSRYWLEGAPTEWNLTAVIQTFGMLGYEPCQNADLEP